MSNALGKKELQALLDENNVEGWNKKTPIEELVQLAVDAKLVDVDEDEDEAPEGEFYLWIKKKIYVNDEERVDAGIYAADKVSKRLRNNPSVVVYEGEVEPGDVVAMARWCGIDPDGRKIEELFALVVNKDAMQPY